MDFVRTPDEHFETLAGYPFEPRYLSLSGGLRMHYVEMGPEHGEPILLLHGQPTWSYLYRSVIPVLSDHGFRVIAPDMVGFGRSDKPTQRTDYTVRAHTNWLLELIVALSLTRITVVVQDWGGPIGLGALVADSSRFARVVAANTAFHTADAALAGRLEWSCHLAADGTLAVKPTLLDYQRMTQEIAPFRPSLFVQGATVSDLTDEVCAGYDAPFPDETFCTGPRQLPLLMGLTPNSACARHNQRIMTYLESAPLPLLTCFSDGDPATRGWDDVLQSAAIGARGQSHRTIEGAGHFIQEDQGPLLAETIGAFVEANPA